jgi:putative phosphoesterase
MSHKGQGRLTVGGMRLVLTTDTHLPKRARDLPDPLWAAIDAADVVIHAGDWVDVAALDAFEARSRRLIACYGNNDGAALRARLPEVARAGLDGVRLAVIHETGDAKGRSARCEAMFPDTDVLVFGHSHIPWDTTTPSGLRLLNPGSPTDRRRQPFCTYMTAAIEGGALTDVVLHEIPRRGGPDRH